MSLESSANDVREIIRMYNGIVALGDALDEAVMAEAKTKAAVKREKEAQANLAKAVSEKDATLIAVANLRAEGEKAIADAKDLASGIRAEAKAKADALAAKSKEKYELLAKQDAIDAEKFAAQKQTNDEILAMTQTQIAHAEAKLSEIRAAIAALTKG